MTDYSRITNGEIDPMTSGNSNTGWNPNGQSHHWNPDGTITQDPFGYDADVAALRQRGAQVGQAPQLNQGQANQSRGMQLSALQLLRQQGDGSAPSSAAILSQRANQDAIRNAALQTTGAKSVGAGIAANRDAGAAAGNAMLAGNAANANLRAAEIARGQVGYAGGAGQVQGQDIGAATANAQLVQGQRGLNEQHQQANEQMAWDTRNQGMQNVGRYSDIEHQDLAAQHAKEAADQAATKQFVSDAKSAATGGLVGATHSDERTKTHVMPMGALASLRHGRR